MSQTLWGANEREWEDIFRRYQAANAWLQSLITDPLGKRYELAQSPEDMRRGQEAQIARMERFLAALGNPQNGRHVIHVAGTGGKGSVATMVEALLRSTGVKSGLHISPYVQVPNEKLVANGKMVSPSGFTDLVESFGLRYESYIAAGGERPKFGEAWVALTHLFFERNGVQWASLETGMGGRFDPTNVVNSDVAIITNVDYDHVPQLGTTLPEIAWHKAGIIKPGKPVVTAETKPEAIGVISREAAAKDAPLYALGQAFHVESVRQHAGGVSATIRTPWRTIEDLDISLAGAYQATNAALALTAVELLSEKHQGALSLTEEMIRQAMRGLRIAGRMEVMQENPLVIIDGAHNPQKMQAAASALKEDYPEGRKVLIVGMLKTKDAHASLQHILPCVDVVITTEPHVIGKPSFSAADLAQLVRTLNPKLDVQAQPVVQEAISLGLRESARQDLLFITGSIYMLEDAREVWYPKERLLRELEYS
ncbi:MAG TPA: cyanophycin synthetase [Chloroflexia bacterium]